MGPEGLFCERSLVSFGTETLKMVLFCPAPSFHKTSSVSSFLVLRGKLSLLSAFSISNGFKLWFLIISNVFLTVPFFCIFELCQNFVHINFSDLLAPIEMKSKKRKLSAFLLN